MTAYSGYGAIFPDYPIFHVILFFLWILAAVGVFFIQDWGRHLFAAMCLLALIMSPLNGVSITNPLETFLLDVSATLDGVILALVYLSPLSDFFGEKSSVKTGSYSH